MSVTEFKFGPLEAPAVPMVRAELLRPTLAFLDQIGSPIARNPAAYGLPVDSRTDGHTALPLHSVYRFLSEVARYEQIDDLGARIAAQADIRALGSLGNYLSPSETIRDFLCTAIRMLRRVSSGDIYWLTISGSVATMRHSYPPSDEAGSRHADAYGIVLTLRIMQATLGANWRPKDISLSQATEATAAFIRETFEVAVRRTDGFSSVRFDAADLDRRFSAHPARRTPMLSPAVLGDELPIRLIDGLEALVVSELSNGNFDIHRASAATNLPVRTLQRQLENEGITWRELVSRARYKEACRLIATTDRKITDIAADLGYEHPGNFTRAFLKMAGCSPQEFRVAARGAANYSGFGIDVPQRSTFLPDI